MAMTKYPHTRAQLGYIAQQHKPETEQGVSEEEVQQVVVLLGDEKDDELKRVLQARYGMDDERAEQNVLDLMHKHRDDLARIPFLYLTPTIARRPLSRPSSRASTPSSAPPSPLIHHVLQMQRRPHTPATASPTLPPIQAQWTASLPASPILSPSLLSAKASEFRPIPRPLSAAATHPQSHTSGFLLSRNETPPPDLWAHSSSPRATSNLAIAAPLVADHSPATRPSTPKPENTSRDDDDDPFDPFNPANVIPSFVSDFDNTYDQTGLWPNHYPYPSHYGPLPANMSHLSDPNIDSEDSSLLTDGMTPFDVLTSVFGSTLAPSELEDALKVNGFDFDKAMSWLVDAYPAATSNNQPSQNQPQQPNNNNRLQQMGSRVSVVSRDAIGAIRGTSNGTRGAYLSAPPNPRAPRYLNGRPVPSGNRVCRYFVAGECLRADCRFSHDLERALCRFWLRGTCAKQENCEFLHHLPKDVDVNALNALIVRNNYNIPPIPGVAASQNPQPNEEFPALGYDPNPPSPARPRKFSVYDPSRTRFANAVKKPAPPQQASSSEDQTAAASSTFTIVAPKPSPRLKLRPPTLLPTLPMGEAVNKLYLSYRTRALQLGAQRNSCLSRAAEAWRRGDGAGAKRWSREGEEMNRRMREEMALAAGDLVRERARVVEALVRGSGTHVAAVAADPADRTVRGKVVGGTLGVCLGVAPGRGEQSAEERTEVMVDLHGLHANEATEVLESFLLALEQEHFLGLAYAVVGEEKHTGTGPAVTLSSQQQDSASAPSSTATGGAGNNNNGASSSSASGSQNTNGSGASARTGGGAGGATTRRLASGVKEWLHRWGYPWSERDGTICIDPLTHLSE